MRQSACMVVKPIMTDNFASLFSRWVITKTYLYNFDPLKPHFYIVKLGFTGVYIICIISAQNKDCGYSLEPPPRGGSNEYPQSKFWADGGGSNKYPQSMLWAETWKNIRIFYLKMFIFLVVKFSVCLNRYVFVMRASDWMATLSSIFFYWRLGIAVCGRTSYLHRAVYFVSTQFCGYLCFIVMFHW